MSEEEQIRLRKRLQALEELVATQREEMELLREESRVIREEMAAQQRHYREQDEAWKRSHPYLHG